MSSPKKNHQHSFVSVDLVALCEEINSLKRDYTFTKGKARRKERRQIKLIVNKKIEDFNKIVKFTAINKI